MRLDPYARLIDVDCDGELEAVGIDTWRAVTVRSPAGTKAEINFVRCKFLFDGP